MPFIPDAETTGRFIPDEGSFIPDADATAPPRGSTAQLAPLTSGAFHPGRENPELGLYTPRVTVPNLGLPPSEESRRRAINAEIERMNAQELRAIDAEYPSVAIPTEVPGTELPRTPIQLPRFVADERASLPAQVGVGLYNVGAGLVEFPLNPEGAALTAATAGAGVAGGVLKRLAGAGWAAYGVKETPHLVEEAKKALETGTPQQKTEALAALGVNTLITVGGAKGALKPSGAKATEPTPEAKPGDVIETTKAPETPQTASEPTVRLWRGETPPVERSKSEASKIDVATFEPEEFRGRWWTDRRELAEPFTKREGKSVGELYYLDVPKSIAEQYRISNLPKSAKERAHSLSPSAEFVLPAELAAKKQKLSRPPPETAPAGKPEAVAGAPETGPSRMTAYHGTTREISGESIKPSIQGTFGPAVYLGIKESGGSASYHAKGGILRNKQEATKIRTDLELNKPLDLRRNGLASQALFDESIKMLRERWETLPDSLQRLNETLRKLRNPNFDGTGLNLWDTFSKFYGDVFHGVRNQQVIGSIIGDAAKRLGYDAVIYPSNIKGDVQFESPKDVSMAVFSEVPIGRKPIPEQPLKAATAVDVEIVPPEQQRAAPKKKAAVTLYEQDIELAKLLEEDGSLNTRIRELVSQKKQQWEKAYDQGKEPPAFSGDAEIARIEKRLQQIREEMQPLLKSRDEQRSAAATRYWNEQAAQGQPVKTEPAPPSTEPAISFPGLGQRPDKPQGPKWTTATDEPPLGTALYGPFGIPSPTATARAVAGLAKAAAPKVKEAFGAVKEIGDEIVRAGKMTDYRRSVLNWSAKGQRSFGEAAAAQKEINQRAPSEVKREGITNWIQAGGDANVLAQRAAATTDPKLKAGYEAALNLTPEELAVASDVKAAFDALGQRGQHYGVLNNFRDNYVTQIWDLGKGPATGSSRTLKDKFRYSKARTFDSFFDGEQAGYTPKTKDIAKLLPVYMHEMNSVIAARQLVEQMSKGVASDGRPLVAPRGIGIQVEGPQGQATLIVPKAPKGDRRDYKMLENQPALSEWVWRTEDSAGNPVFEKADLALHPEAHAKLKYVLGRSAIREWYGTRTSALAQLPKKLVQALDVAQSETKRTMLGFFAPFHQVQEGTHAVGHRINPFFNIPKIDLVGNAAQMDAARHGLMLLPDRVSEGQFMEGFKVSGIVSRIPGIGPLADWYSNYLFKEYIPGLKYKTYEAILERNTRVYEKELASGEFKPEDIKVLSAEQANAAYGHLNYADLARNPTIQHIMQMGLLAPDFLEARARFAGQAARGAAGAKVGREQVIALATLAVAQAVTAWIAAKTTGGEWDREHPFEFTHGSRKYTMRSVPEDIAGLIQNTRGFVNSRLSPIIGKGALQYASGVDYAQRKVSAAQTTKELVTAPVPLTLRSIPAVKQLTGMDRPGQVSPLEQLASAMGLRISRNYPRQKLDELHNQFLEKHEDPKVRADYERHLTETVPVSKYKAVYSALADRDAAALKKAVAELEAEGETVKAIKRRLNPRTVDGRQKTLFHERRSLEREFRDSLTPEQYKLYEDALEERREQFWFFMQHH